MKRIITVIALAIVAACDTATAPDAEKANAPGFLPPPSLATVEREHDRTSFQQTVNNRCTGEMVRISGTLHLIDQVVTMDDGEIRTVFHTNIQNAVGVGLTSGNKYRATLVDHNTWQGAPAGGGLQGGPWRTSHPGTLHLVVPGEGVSMHWHFVFVVTKEPGSPPNLIVAKSEVTCH